MAQSLRKTPLSEWHAAHGARMVDFAGFWMPVQYSGGIQEEVHAVRERAGLFDLCHMGRLVLTGARCVEAADHVLSQNVAKIPQGAIRYALICTHDGGVIDDVLVYRDADRVHVVINASNRETDDAWFREKTAAYGVTVDNVSDDQTMLALQGRESAGILAGMCDADLSALRYYRFTRGKLLGSIDAIVSRTGYTGEDGFELFFPQQDAALVWEELLRQGADAGLQPIGLGARDVCRTEAGMPLYGHELSREISPLEAQVPFGIDLGKDFIGADALRAQKERGVRRLLVGLGVPGRRVPREGCLLYAGSDEAGRVTSGTFSPTLDRPIAMALVSSGLARPGTPLQADLKGKRIDTVVEELPFYSRKRKKKGEGK